MNYKVTRQQILDAAASMLGWSFRHQARGEANSVDCVGFLVVMGRKIGYPWIADVEGYRRAPSAEIIRQTLKANCDEIPAEEVMPGDIYLMRLGGVKPRHASILFSNKTNIERGIEPQIIHASNLGVRIEPVSNFPPAWFVAGFRVRGLIE